MNFRFRFLIFPFLAIPFLLLQFGCSKLEPSSIAILDTNAFEPLQFDEPFAQVPATEDIVLYEINERAFSVSGTLNGILPRLDSLKALNINTIWLMPIHPIGVQNSINSPYCVKNYFEVNPEYGTLADLRNLVHEAHKRGMAIILDWVANHTSFDNPWTQDSSWYVLNSSGNISYPPGTNWRDVAELNFNNSAMRLEMIKAMKYWILTANIDGYRCDAADYVPFSFWKQAIDSLKKMPNRKLILLAEGGRSDHFSAGFQMNFGWSFYDKVLNVFRYNNYAYGIYSSHMTETGTLPANAYKLRFTSNHDKCAYDNTPLVNYGGKRGSIAAFVITSFMGGIPLIYNGQEVGCPNKLPITSKLPINWTTNSDMLLEYKFLMDFRHNHPAIRYGNLESFSDKDFVAFKRSLGQDKVFVLVNTRNSSEQFIVPTSIQNSTWQNSLTGAMETFGNNMLLNPYEYRIYHN